MIPPIHIWIWGWGNWFNFFSCNSLREWKKKWILYGLPKGNPFFVITKLSVPIVQLHIFLFGGDNKFFFQKKNCPSDSSNQDKECMWISPAGTRATKSSRVLTLFHSPIFQLQELGWQSTDNRTFDTFSIRKSKLKHPRWRAFYEKTTACWGSQNTCGFCRSTQLQNFSNWLTNSVYGSLIACVLLLFFLLELPFNSYSSLQ